MSGKPVVRVQAGDSVGATARPVASGGMPRTSYAAADRGHPSVGAWLPHLRSADGDWLRDRPLSVARVRDIKRNEGWAEAGDDRQVDMMVGAALRLNSRPDPVALGIDAPEARRLGRQIESQFQLWANDPIVRSDAERTLGFSGQAALVAREFVGMGEALAVLRWLPRGNWAFRTALQTIDCDRLSNPNGQPDTDTLRGGIEKDRNNAPIAYHIRRGHPSDGLLSSAASFTWDRVPRWDVVGDWERPKVLHVFDKRRPGQSRGVAKLVANLTKLRSLSRYSESEVRTAAINASIVGSLYTQMGAEYAADRLGSDPTPGADWTTFNEQRASFYADRQVLDDARFLTLFPSDRLDLNTTPRQTAGYPAFQRSFLQALAATLGISYEQLSMDWSQTNYSSARAALNEVWRGIHRLREILVNMFAVPTYAAWLEDALDAGVIDVPEGCADFYDAPAAWLRCTWIGPGRGFIDPVKEMQAAGLRVDGMLSTLQREAAEQGEDWEQILDQQEFEQDELERRGLVRSRGDTTITARTDLPDDRAGNPTNQSGQGA